LVVLDLKDSVKIVTTMNTLMKKEKRLEKRRAPNDRGRDAGKSTKKQNMVIQTLLPVSLSFIQSGSPSTWNFSNVLGIVVFRSTQ